MKKISHFLVMLVAAAITVLGTACSNSASTPTYLGTKAPSEPKEVGDIVFNDGSAMAYTDFAALSDEEKNAKKASAIALIFYKGTGLNSGDDTTTSRTLGVGLKHSDKIRWCWNFEKALNKNITTIQCPASESAGGLTFTGDRNGSDNFEQIGAFLKASEEGVDDTSEVGKYRYPVFYFTKNYSSTATNLGTSYASGWYLPSSAELFQIYACRADTTNGFNIDAASETLGGDKFDSKKYWSSSQSDVVDRGVYLLYFETGSFGNNWGKNNEFYACCIREF